MLKKTITYDNYNGDTVAEDFYFNFTKLEIMEKLELDELQATIERLTETDNAKEAYQLFKKLILDAYGEKSPDGRQFIKSPEITQRFEQSPALSEMIIEFLQNPALGGQFIEGTLPPKLVAEAKAAQANNPTDAEVTAMVHEAERRQENPDTAVLPTAPPVLAKPLRRSFDDYSEAELLEMSAPEFQDLVPRDPKHMSKAQLMIAFQRKAAAQ